ncbi:glycoside hydrolase family 43 protein [Streptomyces sp. NPDC020983]|uniref:glycoside hydrolase family 43 protein n=1 Tax=Streptomyces sp. NPDC020983 TaxID=3365106 RepID=UPI0037BB01B9
MTLTATNPVLPGCFPDPSVVRVGQDYFLASSSFAYYPAIPLHHSRDLVHWRPIGHAIDRAGQIDLGGIRASAGIYAPTLRHAGGRFHLVCTLVDGPGASGNFLLSADDPAGDWSDPVWLPEAPGFDPSLFFDDDGSVHLLGTREVPGTGGRTEIWLRGLDLEAGKLTGPEHVLFTGALVDARWAEGPHLYKVGGWYVLLLAEGGTAHEHAVTVARSREIAGPYENHPGNPVLTHRHLGRSYPVSGAGHADLVQTPAGDWYALVLASRIYGGPHSNLGRETFLARVEWEDGWPVLNPGEGRLTEHVDVALDAHPWPEPDTTDHFDTAELDTAVWNLLRGPAAGAYSLTERPGHLRLRLLPQTLAERGTPAFAGRRQQHIDCAAETELDFTPGAPGEAAGIAVLQNDTHHITLLVTAAADGGTVVRLTEYNAGTATVRGELPVGPGPLRLGLRTRGQDYTFSVTRSPDGRRDVGTVDGRFLSSQVAGGFTGVYLGPYATGPAGGTGHADYDWFRYGPAAD